MVINHNGTRLVEGKDHTISYKNNINTGLGKVIITGINDYNGQLTKEFKIIPQNISSLKVTSNSTSAVQLSWNSSKGANGYTIYRYSTSSKKYIRIGTVEGGNKTMYGDINKSSATIYTYRVKPIKKINGTTYYGDYAQVKTTTKPLQPKVSLKSIKKGSITISWGKVNRATGYKIYRSTSPNGPFTLEKTINSGNMTSYSNKGRVSGKRYYYKVRAFRTSDKTNIYSSYSSLKNIKCK